MGVSVGGGENEAIGQQGQSEGCRGGPRAPRREMGRVEGCGVSVTSAGYAEEVRATPWRGGGGRRVRAPRGACVQPLGVPRLPHAAQRPAPSAPTLGGWGWGSSSEPRVGASRPGEGKGCPRHGGSPEAHLASPSQPLPAPLPAPSRLPPPSGGAKFSGAGTRSLQGCASRGRRTEGHPLASLYPTCCPGPFQVAARPAASGRWGGGAGPRGLPIPPWLLLQRCLAGNRGPPGDGDSPLLGPGLSCAPTHGASALASLSGLPSSCPSPRASRWRAWLPPGRRHPALRPPRDPRPSAPPPHPSRPQPRRPVPRPGPRVWRPLSACLFC